MSQVFKKILGKFSKKKSIPKTENYNKDGVKMNVKGQRVVENESGPNLRISSLDNELYRLDKGPQMLNPRIRFKVWLMLFGIGMYFFLCYKLMLYRLKSDDLDLMEREVNEDESIKSKVKELNKI